MVRVRHSLRSWKQRSTRTSAHVRMWRVWIAVGITWSGRLLQAPYSPLIGGVNKAETCGSHDACHLVVIIIIASRAPLAIMVADIVRSLSKGIIVTIMNMFILLSC